MTVLEDVIVYPKSAHRPRRYARYVPADATPETYRAPQRDKHRTPTIPQLQRTLDAVFGDRNAIATTPDTHPRLNYSMHDGPDCTYVWLNYTGLDHAEVGAVLRACGYPVVKYYGLHDTAYVPHYVIR